MGPSELRWVLGGGCEALRAEVGCGGLRTRILGGPQS